MPEMPAYRADFYLIAEVKNFQLDESSRKIFDVLKRIPEIENLKMTKMTKDVEELGRIKVEEWYEMTGGLKIPEGFKAFWVLCKDKDAEESYNLFIRIDRNVAAENYNEAQAKAKEWIEKTFAQPLKENFEVERFEIKSPTELSSVKPQQRPQK